MSRDLCSYDEERGPAMASNVQARSLQDLDDDFLSRGAVGIPSDRSKLWDGGTFLIKVPETAKLIESKHAGTYLAWYYGRVQIFLKADDVEQYRARQVIVAGELWRKTWEDGRESLYLDLSGPVERADGKLSTHEFKVHGGPIKKDREPVFKVSVPDSGGVVGIYLYVPFVRPQK